MMIASSHAGTIPACPIKQKSRQYPQYGETHDKDQNSNHTVVCPDCCAGSLFCHVGVFYVSLLSMLCQAIHATTATMAAGARRVTICTHRLIATHTKIKASTVSNILTAILDCAGFVSISLVFPAVSKFRKEAVPPAFFYTVFIDVCF